MSVLIFLGVLFVLVLVHEWGHFIAAKKTGMRVDEFAIGFPPKLFGIKRGETTYNFNALPIGGYVKIYGENKEESDDNGPTPDLVRAFSSKPKWAQAVVLLAGVTMNVLFAWLLFTIVLMSGVPSAVDEATAGDSAQLYVAGVLPESPAAAALPVGAIITVVAAGENILTNPTPTAFSEFVTSNAPAPLSVTYEANDQTETVSITPVQGLAEGDADKYLVGTSLALVEVVQRPLHLAIRDGFTSTLDGLVGITTGLLTLLGNAVVGEGDFSNIAGPIGIVGMVGDAADFGLVALLSFTAIISLNLAVINLLPFPALDGGRLLFVIVETITGKEIPSHVAGWTNGVGFILLMLLMLAVTYNDILRLL